MKRLILLSLLTVSTASASENVCHLDVKYIASDAKPFAVSVDADLSLCKAHFEGAISSGRFSNVTMDHKDSQGKETQLTFKQSLALDEYGSPQ